MTGLHWACKRNFTELASLLIKEKALLNSLDLLNRYPIYFAIQNRNEKIISRLVGQNSPLWPKVPEHDYLKMLMGSPYLLIILKDARRVGVAHSGHALHQSQEEGAPRTSS